MTSMHIKTEYRNAAVTSQSVSYFLLGLVYAGTLLTIYVLVSGETADAVTYVFLALWFVGLAAIYLAKRGYEATLLCSLPAVVTIMGLVEFIGVPTWRLINGDDRMDSKYVPALSLVLVGYVALWLGSWAFMKKDRLRFVPEVTSTPPRTVLASSCMLIVGVVATVIEWKLGIYSYMRDTRFEPIAAAQWLDSGAQLIGGAVLISGIEVLGKKNTVVMRVIFCLSLGLMFGFGVISGMKGEVLKPFLLVVLVHAITRGRIPRMSWLLIPFLILVVYPFATAYRKNLNTGYRAQANTVDGLEATVGKSFSDAFGGGVTDSKAVSANVDSSTLRLSLLTCVRDVISIGNMSLLAGDEKIYLAPFYPLIPRFLWKNKPVLDKGRRLSVALGHPITSSSAITPIGDLYSLNGWFGVAAGMLLYGIGAELFMNKLGGSLSEKGVFFLLAVVPVLTNLERDVVSSIAAGFQSCLMFLLMAYIIYGGRLFSLRSGRPVGSAVPAV
jgi:hypothetical protein